ncbi:putative CRISPR-associated protein [Anabaena catenula]|uniref:CRISPR-associated protein n=1 Tax=Anabaena catenula FACHB-362 TaxID=2692877 RepID=A0ABR8IXV2_9NOST|nr:putative CRISPR-associated protein [Anabaena catenula]MBD2690909.1 putative CRISPR-associated protein [Anabaena catenula FACHB-362]
MYRFVVSTVGTSLLTNQIRQKADPKNWKELLDKTAHLTDEQIKQSSPEIIDILSELTSRAEEQLKSGNTLEIKEASAELNGIYSLYEDNVDNGKLDYHWLITTDTAQGQITAKIIQGFLNKKINCIEIYTPYELSVKNTSKFKPGIDDLIDWLSKKYKEAKKDGYDIYFNLVGGFKAIQGCMNTIGMFYADKIIYVFEGSSSSLITIPRLPITVDYERVKKHQVNLALLNAGASLSPSLTEKIEEALVAEIDGKITISNWGQLIWHQCKDKFLSSDLLDFPKIDYDDTFRKDYKSINDPQHRVKLQETLAKVSYQFEESNGDTRVLGKTVSYYAYQGAKDKEGIDHFYVGIQFRISCKVVNGRLKLRHYGTHDYVETKETN